MTDIGVLPSKTGVRITSTSGKHGDIPAADESLAGVATPELIKIVSALDAWKRGIEAGRDGAKAETDIITRKELTEALARAASPMLVMSADGAPLPSDPRLDAMETRLSTLETRSTGAIQALGSRLQAVEGSARRAGSGLTSGETEKLVSSLIDTKLALAPAHGPDMTPELTTINARIDDLGAKVARLPQQPALLPDSVEHLQQIFAALGNLNERLASVERVIETLKLLSAYKADEETEAA